MNSQTQLETQRVLAIVDDLLQDLKVLTYLPSNATDFEEELQQLPQDDQDRVNELFDLEGKVEMGQSATNEELCFAHKNSVREIVELLKEMRFAEECDEDTDTDYNPAINEFRQTIDTLRGLVYNKFNTTAEEDLQKFEILRDTVSREQTASADVKALNREFKSEQSLRKTEVAKRDLAIAKLTEELKSIEDNAQEDAKEFERVTREQQQQDLQTYQREEEELLTQVKQLEGRLSGAREKNNKEEASLRQERRRKEMYLEGLLQQYDGEMTEKTEEHSTLQKEFKTDGEKLTKIESELAVLEEDRAQRDTDEQIETERKMHHMEVLMRMEGASRLVQAFWRGYAVRAMLRKKKAGKKKKGKKGKKGKKR